MFLVLLVENSGLSSEGLSFDEKMVAATELYQKGKFKPPQAKPVQYGITTGDALKKKV